MKDKLFPSLKGLFSKWYCPNCNTILNRNQIKYQSEFKSYYSIFWFRCLKCGKTDGVKTLKERLEEIALNK